MRCVNSAQGLVGPAEAAARGHGGAGFRGRRRAWTRSIACRMRGNGSGNSRLERPDRSFVTESAGAETYCEVEEQLESTRERGRVACESIGQPR